MSQSPPPLLSIDNLLSKQHAGAPEVFCPVAVSCVDGVCTRVLLRKGHEVIPPCSRCVDRNLQTFVLVLVLLHYKV